MKKLTKRERFLLTILLFAFIIGGGIGIWLLPLYERTSILQKEHDLLAIREKEVRQTLQQTDTILSQKASLLEEIDALRRVLAKPLETQEFDLIIADLANQNGVVLRSVRYAPIEDQVVNDKTVSNQSITLNVGGTMHEVQGLLDALHGISYTLVVNRFDYNTTSQSATIQLSIYFLQ